MTSRQIHHIGFLVADLEAAIDRWSAVTGFTFTPIARYRTERWVDSGAEGPQHHDVRVAFSRQGPPFIELTAFHGSGSHSPHIHSPQQGEGYHHLAFLNDDQPDSCMAELERLGVGADGVSLNEDGQPIFWFTDKRDLYGARTEMIFPGEQLLVREDDGRILDLDILR